MTRACARCAEPVPDELRKNARFCSDKCRLYVGHQRERIARAYAREHKERQKPYLVVCGECATAFETTYRKQKFCSTRCAGKNRCKRREVIRHARPAGTVSKRRGPTDNGTLPPDLVVNEEQRYLFDYRCLMCSRRQQEAQLMTRARARLIAAAGVLPRCFACNGMVYLDEVDLLDRASPIYGHNTAYAELARKWSAA